MPIVVLTSADGDGIADRCLLAGAEAYRQKGRLAPAEYGQRLRRAIQRGHEPTETDCPRAR